MKRKATKKPPICMTDKFGTIIASLYLDINANEGDNKKINDIWLG